eukprot:CAMPEP_0185603478 /NCGR_PEP_ID=MMETSP0436-20130131/2508_1 /TAXON_ID=626734 ORGANISM="Favella taraikaensis, Strain Fe Narragansett Bay" /NCGR_SAMPLE_ID=MMETSP0436 /ASSEMBLY_ACC=CAM_ASM_000390 /LENGTH=65 /DNA_ID=CAMNT_0028233975 /DNA_START=28 /DNA_END=225 /DNA_ORIENTATION=+
MAISLETEQQPMMPPGAFPGSPANDFMQDLAQLVAESDAISESKSALASSPSFCDVIASKNKTEP